MSGRPFDRATDIMAPLHLRPRVFDLGGAPDVGELLGALRGARGLAALDSAGGSPASWSWVLFDPIVITRGARARPRELADLRGLVARLEPRGGERPPGPFAGGFVGALAYDLGVAGERQRLPRDPHSPPIAGGLYVDFVVIEHRARRAWLVLGEEPGDGRPPVRVRRDRFLGRLGAPPRAPLVRPLGPLVRHVSGAAFRERIERARARIAQGEIYQANLAHRFSRTVAGEPVDLYRRLRRVNPAPYMGYLACGRRTALLSASPELLLELEGGSARTRPIKGTAGRDPDPARDALARRRLLESAKDRAELAMIVDLERNDLGRIARPGSVRVEGFPRLESYAAVHHLTADVVAEPRAGTDAVDVLAALFPGGSISGAPKLRSMDVIAELEGEGRGFFCGAMGFLDVLGRARFNVLIRTLVWRATRPGVGEVGFHVGAGITWSSDAAAEERETLYKGAALAAALSGTDEAPDTLGIALPAPEQEAARAGL